MRITVLLFGALADAIGRRETVDLDPPVAAADVVRAVRCRHPGASGIVDRCAVAVNLEVVAPEHPIEQGDEVALLPPAAGGAITTNPSVASVLAATSSEAAGGTVVFVGTVRDSSDAGPVDALEYSAYDEMAEKVIAEITTEARDRWDLVGVAVEHAVGVRSLGEITFVVACSAAHREEAFEACRYVVDEVKRRVPIWKKESGPWGTRWTGL